MYCTYISRVRLKFPFIMRGRKKEKETGIRYSRGREKERRIEEGKREKRKKHTLTVRHTIIHRDGDKHKENSYTEETQTVADTDRRWKDKQTDREGRVYCI